MSNKKVVQDHLEFMRNLGFRAMSFLVHEDDVNEVRTLVDNLKEKRMSIFLNPKDTLEEMRRLNLDNKSFGLMHHFNDRASVTAHLNYLKKISQYQKNSKNYVVAQRIHKLDFLVREKINFDTAIKEVVKEFPFF